MNPAVDITGQRFGRLTVLRRDTEGHNKGRAYWVCKCDCGKEHSASGINLRSGRVQSCGCASIEHTRRMGKANAGSGRGRKGLDGGHKYHITEKRLYNVWVVMRERCNNPKWPQYKGYGARGITVCEEWNKFENFMIWAYANGYDKDAKRGECTIDRIDNDKGYYPDNCRWVSQRDQAGNRRPRSSKTE